MCFAYKVGLEFNYDYMGRRIEKKVFNSNVLAKHLKFVYDGYKLIAEVDGMNNNAQLRRYTWNAPETGLDTPLAVYDVATATSYFYRTDANRNVIALTNASGLKAWYEYSPFGVTLTATGDAAELNPFRFSSEYADSETGLVYYNYRYYNPELGRWLSRDPIAEEGGENLYGFVNNNPTALFDMNGLKSVGTPQSRRKLRFKIGFDDTAQATKEMITALNQFKDEMKNTIYKCCKNFGLACDMDVLFEFDYNQKKAGTYNGDDDYGEINIQNSIAGHTDAVPVLITSKTLDNNDTIIAQAFNDYGITMSSSQFLNKDIMESMNVLAHELGHVFNYKGDYPDDPAHAKNKSNLMYPYNTKDSNDPDECYCKNLNNNVK